MRLHEWYAKHFDEYGDIVALKHPYFNKNIQVNSACLFHKHCKQEESVLCMSSRKGDVQFSVCTGCLQNYFTSWAQNDEQTFEYHLYASGVDLTQELLNENTSTS